LYYTTSSIFYTIVYVTIVISIHYEDNIYGYILIKYNINNNHERPQKSHYPFLLSSDPQPKFNLILNNKSSIFYLTACALAINVFHSILSIFVITIPLCSHCSMNSILLTFNICYFIFPLKIVKKLCCFHHWKTYNVGTMLHSFCTGQSVTVKSICIRIGYTKIIEWSYRFRPCVYCELSLISRFNDKL